MSCCKGYRATCKTCGMRGCDRCCVTIHTETGSYCSECDNNNRTQTERQRLQDRNRYLKTLLKTNNVEYEHSDDSYSAEEPYVPDPNDPNYDSDGNCKMQ